MSGSPVPDRTEPYVAVIFSSELAVDDPAYAEAAARMIELASGMPGFLGIESARSDGLGLTVSYWENDDAVAAWRTHPEHLEIQARGRRDWYQWYTVRVAEVGRTRSFTRLGAAET